MQRIDHPLFCSSLGSHKTITSLHFGTSGSGQKIYIQASLHAEELPGMLTAYHLRPMLEAAEAAGHIKGEIVLVPMANPIGLAQRLDHKPNGRFEFDSSENFNRHYPDFATAVFPHVVGKLGSDAQRNVALVRSAMAEYLCNWTPKTELQSLRKTLVTLAHDADMVLDLHCDCEAVMYMFCDDTCWPQFEPIARFLGVRAILLAKGSGGNCFDECLSSVWWQLSEALQAAGDHSPLPQGCCSTTIELRGDLDVNHHYAKQDANALFAALEHIGVLDTGHVPAMPAALCVPTPLTGSETLVSDVPGVVAFSAELGQHMKVGDLVAEVINPLTDESHQIRAGVEGLFYARINNRYVTAGCDVGNIAGSVPFRTGSLLGD